MAIFKSSYHYTIVDVNGDTANVTLESSESDMGVVGDIVTNANTFGAALIAASNGKIIKQSWSFVILEAHLIVGTTPPTNAEYSSVTDGARLTFSNSLGERSALTVPAPKESDFGASSNVVDSTNTNVAALIAAYIALATDASNNPINLYQGGIKVGRRARRRRNARVP